MVGLETVEAVVEDEFVAKAEQIGRGGSLEVVFDLDGLSIADWTADLLVKQHINDDATITRLNLTADISTNTWTTLLTSADTETLQPGLWYSLGRLRNINTGEERQIRSRGVRFQVLESIVTPFIPAANPKDVAGLVAWFDAALDVLLVPEGVSTWGDQSGLFNHASQGTGSKRPALGGLGSFPGIVFDGTDDELAAVDNNSLDIAASFTAYAVIQPPDFDAFYTIFGKNGNNFRLITAPTTGQLRIEAASVAFISPAGIPVNEISIVEVHFDMTNGGTINFTRNGSSLGTATSSITSIVPDSSPFKIGQAFVNPNETQYYKGPIAQLLLYNNLLSTDSRNSVIGYLANRYQVNRTVIG